MGSSAGAGGAAGEEGAVFQSYVGPVLPLALSEENEAVTAERTLTWRFAPWEKVWISHEEAADRSGLTGSDRQALLEDLWETWPEGGRYESSTDVQVTDAYTLTNKQTRTSTSPSAIPSPPPCAPWRRKRRC